jgi:hypothetical protein
MFEKLVLEKLVLEKADGDWGDISTNPFTHSN